MKELETSEGRYLARTVVIATGATARPLGAAGEADLVGRGIHYCAACDGMAYRGKDGGPLLAAVTLRLPMPCSSPELRKR